MLIKSTFQNKVIALTSGAITNLDFGLMNFKYSHQSFLRLESKMDQSKMCQSNNAFGNAFDNLLKLLKLRS